jgi:hypothetical protein
MEHVCAQCGIAVEDGQPFCPNCRTPQIKVPVRPPTAPVTEPLPPGTPEDVQPPAEPMVNPRPLAPRERDRLLWRPAFSAALMAGMLAAVGTSIPIVPVAMLCMFAAGGLAVTLYRRRAGHPRVSTWMGAKLGVMAGGFGFGLLAVLSTIRLFSPSQRTELRAGFSERMSQAMANAADPEVRHAMEQFRDYIATDRGLISMMLVFVLIAAIFFLIVSALGGALGAFLFGRDSGHKES